ncbi:hypothetical protein cypCar_00024602, partial [Cyprinus carpio]
LILCIPVYCCVCVLYENVNLRRGQKGRSELDIPRYHELVALQEEKKRFSPVKDETPPVGPGAYSVFEYGLAYESLKKACLESTRKGAFGSIAPCWLFLPSKKEMSRPGPTQYK